MITGLYIERDTYTHMHANKHPCIHMHAITIKTCINLDCLLELTCASVLQVNDC